MTNVCVFLGPTLAAQEAAGILDAVYLPPAAQGDVYLAVNEGAEAIGIVDGYFQGAPSVWHKEILWAMSRGVHVFGSASMGALRAAELHEFGMRGVGRIFEDYRDGVLTDDDEVAVVHGPEELGYKATTVPLVNVRATLTRALEEELIASDAHEALLDAARSLFYWNRTYSVLIRQCEGDVDGHDLQQFADWVNHNAVDQKRNDALGMLERMRESPAGPLRVTYQFQRTSAWENLLVEASARTEDPALPAQRTDDRVLDELRLEPRLYRQVLGISSAQDCESHGAVQSRNPLISGLVESGHYEQLAARAADKHRVLTDRYGNLPEYADAMLTPSEVLEWYFEDSCGTAVPMDLEGYARELGLATTGAVCRLLLRELLYELSLDVGQVNGAPV